MCSGRMYIYTPFITHRTCIYSIIYLYTVVRWVACVAVLEQWKSRGGEKKSDVHAELSDRTVLWICAALNREKLLLLLLLMPREKRLETRLRLARW